MKKQLVVAHINYVESFGSLAGWKLANRHHRIVDQAALFHEFRQPFWRIQESLAAEPAHLQVKAIVNGTKMFRNHSDESSVELVQRLIIRGPVPIWQKPRVATG